MVSKFASRRTVLMAVFLMLATLWFCPTLMAQTAATPVISSQAVALGNTAWKNTQIWKIIMSSKGDVVAWDGQSNGVYEFPADGSAVKTIIPAPPNVFGTGNWNTGGIAFDADDNLYICYRYSGYILKIPYNAEKKTWEVVITDSTKWAYNAAPATWWYSPIDVNYTPANPKGNGNFIISDEVAKVIFQYTGSGQGNGTPIVGGLKNRAFKTALDRAGNVYFLQDMGQDGAVGVFRVPAGVYGLSGDGKGSLESSWPVCGTPASMPTALDPYYLAMNPPQNVPLQKPCRVDNGLGKGLIGLTTDADGNVFISDQDDDFNSGDPNSTMKGGIFKVSLETFEVTIDGVKYQVTMPNAANMILVAPVQAQGSPLVDPKGNIYVPLWASGWNGIFNITKVFVGSASLPTSPVGQSGATSQVMYSFNSSVTPDDFTFSQGADAQDFEIATGGSCATGTTYSKYQHCNLNVALKSQVVGPTSGQLAMKQGGSTVATSYVHGVGEGAGLAVLTPAAEIAIRSGLHSPKQVATDRWGNFYVADAGSGSVLQYTAGSIDTTQPTPVGSGFTAPTGVTVDGAGNVYVADSGKVVEVPFGGGPQLEVQAGLGTNLGLTADGAGNVYVADPDNKRIVKIPNADSKRLTGNVAPTMGAGFTAPTAVTADDNGNLLVVDGATLYQVFSTGGQSPITNELFSPLAVAQDASGAAYVAQPGGVVRIPRIAGAYDFTRKSTIAIDISTPNSVAVAPSGTVYITDGETAGVVAVGVSGAADFGYVNMGKTAKQTATLINIGNYPLTFESPLYTSNGPNSADFSVPDAGTTLDPGMTIGIDVAMTPVTGVGALTDNGGLHSNAANVALVPLVLTGFGSNGAPSQVTVTYSPAQPIYPGDVTVTVSVAPESGSGVPTGKVVLSVDGQPSKPVVLQNGSAQFTLRKPNGGQHTLLGSYQGDLDYSAVTGSATITIGRANTTSGLTPPVQDPNVPGIFILYQRGDLVTAKVSSPSGLPTGSVVFKEGATQLGTATLDANGYATFNTGSLPLGSHVVVATYAGDTNFNTSDTSAMTLEVVNPTVYIVAKPPTMNITAGTPSGTELTLRSVVGFNSKVQLLCLNLPQYSECTFDVPSPTIKPGVSQTVYVTISTNVPINVGTARLANRPGAGLWLGTTTFAFGLLGMVFGKKTKYNGRVLMIVCCLLIAASAVTGMTGCSGSNYTKTPPAPHVTTPAGTVPVTIQASAGGQVVSLPFTMSVIVK